MKLSLKFIELVAPDNDLPLNQEDLIEKIGTQLGEVEVEGDYRPVYDQALIVRVVKADKLSGSDHLSSCLIDDGGTNNQADRNADGFIQVVCGAPNVEANQLVVWLPPGMVVPETYFKDRFTLTAKSIMGITSNGMLASAKELAIGEDHQGIVVLAQDVKVGTRLSDLLRLDDRIIDIENKMFTHRPDLFGQLGLARELCGIYGRPFKSPVWYDSSRLLSGGQGFALSVNNELSAKDCLRFCAVAIDNISIGPSPLWMQSMLSRTGIRPINNIVDVTNYVMMVTGQPLHAYDLDKLSASKNVAMGVRHALEREKLELLDGRVLELQPEDIVITANGEIAGLGGVMGGKSSEVGKDTKSIVLECANFDMYAIRRTSMRHGIFSEAVTRFSKGQSASQNSCILAYAYDLIQELCPGVSIASEIIDAAKANPEEPKEIRVEFQQISTYLGSDCDQQAIMQTLKNVEITAKKDQDSLVVVPPFWRTDLHLPEDVIEEIARLNGYDKLNQTLPLHSVRPANIDPAIQLDSCIRALLSAGGANELLNYSFIDEDLINYVNQDSSRFFKLSNALSPDLQYYRGSLLPSLLKKVHPNHKAGFDSFALFEIGAAHSTDSVDQDGLPKQHKRLSLIVSALNKTAKTQYQGAAFYQSRRFVDYLFGGLSLSTSPLSFASINTIEESSGFYDLAKSFNQNRAAVIAYEDKTIGLIGEFSQAVSRHLKLPAHCSGFEVDLDAINDLRSSEAGKYRPLSRYPKITQDLTLSFPPTTTFEVIARMLNDTLKDLLAKDMVASLTLKDIYCPENSAAKHWTFALEVESYERTLVEANVTTIVDALKAQKL